MKKITAGLVLGGLLVFGAVSFAGAKAVPNMIANLVKSARMKVEIGPSGEANISGTVSSVSSNLIGVKSWGGNWLITVSSDTVISGQGKATSTAMINVGDSVSVHGFMSSTSSLSISARVIKDLSNQQSKKNVDSENDKGKLDERKNELNGNENGFFQRLKNIFGIGRTDAKPTSITVTGKTICLAHREKGDVQTMECAIGLAGNDGKTYGLSYATKDQAQFDSGKTVTVSGNFIPANTAENKFDKVYDVTGRIEVSSITEVK